MTGHNAVVFFCVVMLMSVTIKKLYKSGAFLYKMRLIAGKNGLNNLVQWVHIIEDEDVSSFLHGNELVFTAGILNRNDEWMLDFVQKLCEVGASAFVVNIGPYTAKIPREVMDYCNSIDLPLFTIPWETKMVDMTRDFCHQIMHNEQKELNIAATLKNIIFGVGELDTQVMQMERYGYLRDSTICFISLYISGNRSDMEDKSDRVKIIAEKTAKSINEHFITFTYNYNRIMVLFDYSDKEIKTFTREFIKTVKCETNGLEFHMGISSNRDGFNNQNSNFERALSAMEMACRRNETINYYDELGIYKVLYMHNDKTVLREFYQEVIGKLQKYDRDHNTQLLQLLRVYLENNGSIQIVSEKQFIHRNTVNNQLKKIENITGYNPLNLEDKVKFFMGFYIKDIL